MTVNELIDHLEDLQRRGLGTRTVEMGGPRHAEYEEVTGIFWSPHEKRICLEASLPRRPAPRGGEAPTP